MILFPIVYENNFPIGSYQPENTVFYRYITLIVSMPMGINYGGYQNLPKLYTDLPLTEINWKNSEY